MCWQLVCIESIGTCYLFDIFSVQWICITLWFALFVCTTFLCTTSALLHSEFVSLSKYVFSLSVPTCMALALYWLWVVSLNSYFECRHLARSEFFEESSGEAQFFCVPDFTTEMMSWMNLFWTLAVRISKFSADRIPCIF